MLLESVKWIAESSMLFAEIGSPFEATVFPGLPRVVLIVGENASGKSLFFRVLASKMLVEVKALPVQISIRERTGEGMRRAFMFGDEVHNSTGGVSARVLETGFRNLDHKQGSLLMLDEPEIGLSSGYARAMGEYIGQMSQQLPPPCHGVVIVTHSRELAKGLRSSLGADPSFVFMGPRAVDFEGWVGSVEYRTVEELLNLKRVSHERLLSTQKLLDK